MEIKWELNSVRQNWVPWNTVKVLSLWLRLCCSSPNPSALPQRPHVLLSRGRPGPDAAPRRAPALQLHRREAPSTALAGMGRSHSHLRGRFLPRAGQAWPKEKIPRPVPSRGYDNTSLSLGELHRLHCYWPLLQYSSKYVQIKESSGAEVQTPNWILGRALEKFSSDCFFSGSF